MQPAKRENSLGGKGCNRWARKQKGKKCGYTENTTGGGASFRGWTLSQSGLEPRQRFCTESVSRGVLPEKSSIHYGIGMKWDPMAPRLVTNEDTKKKPT